jgi:hypothetical protein
VLDCETTIGPEQALLFGGYRHYRVRWTRSGPRLVCVAEGLFYGDDLPARDPEGFAALEGFSREYTPRVGGSDVDRVRSIRLHSRTEFVRDVLLPACSAGATVVNFNAPFDLSRLAVGYGFARGPIFRGGFSFALGSWADEQGQEREDQFLPRLRWRALDAKRALVGLTRPVAGADPYREPRRRGAFLDLRTLAYALTGQSLSLEWACEAFGVSYQKRPVVHGQVTAGNIAYCLEDVEATARLYRALVTEYERWDLDLAPTRAYSPASLAKACLREAGVRPVLQRQPAFPPELLGYAMCAYYGGRAECRVRRVSVPVSYLDFASMYPTVAGLLGLWRFMTCRRLEPVELEPARFERWLGRLTLEQSFNPATWGRLRGFALVQPQADLLPVRARYSRGGNWSIGINPLTSSQPVWVSFPDLLAATLTQGRPPRVLRAISLHPRGQAPGLTRFRIRGSRLFDPASEDLFRVLVEERRRHAADPGRESARTAAALKMVASSAAYGIEAELNRQELTPNPNRLDVHGLHHFQALVKGVEVPGEYYFPPLAALVTGGARLMLALLERLVADLGGQYAFCDTDSMAIIATRHGGLVPCLGGPERDPAGHEYVTALSWEQVDKIIRRFDQLNPYNPELVPSILELEPENLDPQGERRELSCYAISAKRYCLYTLNRDACPEIVKRSEHALGGFYLNPTDPQTDKRVWVTQAWQWLLHDALGLEHAEPDWLDQPALTRFTVSHPRLLAPFTAHNRGKPYCDQIKPANFLLIAHLVQGGHPAGANPRRFALVAPYDSDPRTSLTLPWRNVHDPASPTYRLTTLGIRTRRGYALPPDTAIVKTYRDVLAAYRVHPEPKSLGPDGRPCARDTFGLLSRRPVQTLSITHIGKETNLLDEIQAGLIGDEEQVLTEYHDLQRNSWATIERPALQLLPAQTLASASGLPLRTVQYARAGRQVRKQQRSVLTSTAASIAREVLQAAGITAPSGDLASLRYYLDHSRSQHRQCGGCGQTLTGRQRRWCSGCGSVRCSV